METHRSINLSAPSGFNLKATALSHGWHECTPMSWSEGGHCFQVIDRVGDEVYRVSVVNGTSRGKNPGVRVVVDGHDVDDEKLERVAQGVRVSLALDRDLTEFYALCRAHSALRDVPGIGGGRLLRSASMTENILKFLCSTNVNWTQAVKMINRLAQLGPHHAHFRSLTAWPTPREILRAGKPYLVEVCRLGYRADSILKFCRDVAEGRLDPESFAEQAASPDVPSEEIVRQLRTIHGIGPASAHAILSLLGRYDHLSIDSATIAHAAQAHFAGRKPAPREVEKVYEPYGKWKNLVYWCENWLSWKTARNMVRELELQTPVPRNSPKKQPKKRV